MSNKYSAASLQLHKKLKGKIRIISKVSLKNRNTLTLLYTPGVAEASKAIYEDISVLKKITLKNNTVAVVTDGSAVLGLGNIGAEAALPVMEGKCAIFAQFAGINAFPLCLNIQNTAEIISVIRKISVSFGAINLEDIAAPKCFEIESRLQDLGIPVMHDDQHATAIAVLAGLLNALKITGKNLKNVKIVICGSGAAGNATAKLLHYAGAANIIMTDSSGILSPSRKDMDTYKKTLLTITNPSHISGKLADACKCADVLIGLSRKGLFTQNIIRGMKSDPIVFALANPDPEITLSDANKWGVKMYASGRSDCPNQINNALVFPGFFKGLLTNGILRVTMEMKLQAAYALALVVKHPTPAHFMPTIFNEKVVSAIKHSLSSTSE